MFLSIPTRRALAMLGVSVLFVSCKKQEKQPDEQGKISIGTGRDTSMGSGTGTAMGSGMGTSMGSGTAVNWGSGSSAGTGSAYTPPVDVLSAMTESFVAMKTSFETDWEAFVESLDTFMNLNDTRLDNKGEGPVLKGFGGSLQLSRSGRPVCEQFLKRSNRRLPPVDSSLSEFAGSDLFQVNDVDTTALLWIFGKTSEAPETYELIACRDHANYDEPIAEISTYKSIRIWGSTRSDAKSITLLGWAAGSAKKSKPLLYQRRRVNYGVVVK
jgi:hypothetical protein